MLLAAKQCWGVAMGSVLVADFGRTAAPQPVKGGRVADNKRTGFVLLYRSLLNAPFKSMPERFALWVHLVLEASYDCDEVQFNGNRLSRQRGQVVGSVAQLAGACGISDDSARRSLEWFEAEGMIERSTRRGVRGYTVITITGYDEYQRGISRVFSETDFAELGANFKPASEQGLQADPNNLSAGFHANLDANLHAEDLNNKTNKQTIDPDLNTVGSEFADAPSTPANGDNTPAEQATIPDEAAIHGMSGKTLLWGTPEDLLCAEHMAKDRRVAFERRGLQPPKDPSMARWANDVRLMRERDDRGYRDICELFRFVCQHGRELEFCQSPEKLRAQWDALQLKRVNAQGGVTSRSKPMSNLEAAQQAAQAMKAQGRGLYDDDTPL